LINIREIPSIYIIITHFLVFVLAREVSFYYSHRFLHYGKNYEKYHKKHHEWTSPIAVSAQYADTLEHIFSNLLPVVLGPIIMGSHFVTMVIWSTHVIMRTLNDHSGYRFPWYYDSTRHDLHHEIFTSHYGVECFGLMDWLHGTARTKKLKTR